MKQTEHNPARYRDLLKPFETGEKANAAIEKFFNLVMEARNACALPDVHLLIKFQVIEEGVERTAMVAGHLGNSAEGLNMCAWGVKKEMHDQQVTISALFMETNDEPNEK